MFGQGPTAPPPLLDHIIATDRNAARLIGRVARKNASRATVSMTCSVSVSSRQRRSTFPSNDAAVSISRRDSHQDACRKLRD
jgi:hypothetical protein